MCAECGHNPCVTRCPNATDRVTPHVCFYCKEPILLGEEFLTSEVGNAVHEDCFGYMERSELFRFFGEEEHIKVVEGIYDDDE